MIHTSWAAQVSLHSACKVLKLAIINIDVLKLLQLVLGSTSLCVKILAKTIWMSLGIVIIMHHFAASVHAHLTLLLFHVHTFAHHLVL
eukprot:SAG31_NODE_2753_length_5141_cov_3.640619_2_plen_88_part_00